MTSYSIQTFVLIFKIFHSLPLSEFDYFLSYKSKHIIVYRSNKSSWLNDFYLYPEFNETEHAEEFLSKIGAVYYFCSE